ncbi:MAG: SH3 domain-containing protein [Agathobacter sp.]|nr:SH3 domain-containing protein [Tyzzerella sp.]MBQ6844768.1 SH3 domain-containing protein [Agathobacter sp.]
MEQRIRPRTQQSRNSRRAYIKRKRRQDLTIKATIFIVLIASVIGGAFLIKKFGPSKDVVNVDKYYGIKKENQLAITIDNEVVGAKGMLYDGKPYVEYAVVRDYLNKRFYLDVNENILLYTLSTGTVRVDVGSKDYTLQKETKSKDYVILKIEGNEAYIALDFVQEYTNISFELYEEPDRVMIVSDWGETTVATVKKKTQLREEANVKSAIITDTSKRKEVTIISEDGRWKKIRTEDGYVGYIKSNCLKNQKKITISREFKEQKYSNISKDYTINLAWHVVGSSSANNTVLETIANTKGLTTISPTWFAVKNTSGDIRSFASSQYVNYAHQSDIEVWALVKDFDGGIGSKEETLKLLSKTSNRENLVNQLISAALKHDIDGINVDFENVSKECGEHYLQFLRELSLKCRQNEIVLSVANPVPSYYSTQYDLKEQGEVVDYVIIMGYDEHHKGSPESGPVASLAFVENGIKEALKDVPAEKLINAIPFYTRLWKEVEKTEEELAEQEGTDAAEYPYNVTSQTYGMSKIHVAINNAGAQIVVDETTGQNYAEWEADGATYKVWLEDEEALEAKLKLMKKYKLAGVASWRLGFESSSAWELILKYVN